MIELEFMIWKHGRNNLVLCLKIKKKNRYVWLDKM